MSYEQINSEQVRVYPVGQRKSKAELAQILVDPDAPADVGPYAAALDDLAERMRTARRRGAARMLACGAHLIKNGAQAVVNRLVEAGWLTHVATNGAGSIHDFEFSYLGRSTESVRDNVATGTFGTWDETGKFIHLSVLSGVTEGLGYGAAVGRMIARQELQLPEPKALAAAIAADPAGEATAARADLLSAMTRWKLPGGRIAVPCPHGGQSMLGTAYRAGVPATIHPGIGYDIIYTHPMAGGAAIGRAAYIDFRIFAAGVEKLCDGVMLSVGSAIMGPQVFEKSMSMANNLRLQQGQGVVCGHTIAVVDLADAGGWDWNQGEPPAENPAYYLRFCKSYVRMGGRMAYLQLDNRLFLQGLWQRLKSC